MKINRLMLCCGIFLISSSIYGNNNPIGIFNTITEMFLRPLFLILGSISITYCFKVEGVAEDKP